MKYQELCQSLIALINGGEYFHTDGRFLSEREISERYAVSRTTVRRAILDLRRQGYLLSIHGKGTFVKSLNRSQPLQSIVRCSENYTEIGMIPSKQILKKAVIAANKTVAVNLDIETGEKVLCLDILYKGNRTTFNETISYIPVRRFPGIESADFDETPILEILRAKYDAQPRRTENSIEAVLPTRRLAGHLNITQTTPLILFESVTSGSYKGQYIPMEYFKCYYRTDTLRFSFSQNHDEIR